MEIGKRVWRVFDQGDQVVVNEITYFIISAVNSETVILLPVVE